MFFTKALDELRTPHGGGGRVHHRLCSLDATSAMRPPPFRLQSIMVFRLARFYLYGRIDHARVEDMP